MTKSDIKSTDIRAAILKTFKQPEWAVMWEVAAGTGAVKDNRSADAILMSLWPSRGLDLHGVEIKISRSDWKREAADPAKAERIAAYCDFWWVFVAPGVIHDLAEVPITWGVREFDGKKLITRREASRTEAQPVDRKFLASLMRRTDEGAKRDIRAEVQKEIEAIRAIDTANIRREIDARSSQAQQIIDREKAFQDATGISLAQLTHRNDIKQIGAMLTLLTTAGINDTYGGLDYLLRNLQKSTDQLAKAIAAYDAVAPVRHQVLAEQEGQANAG